MIEIYPIITPLWKTQTLIETFWLCLLWAMERIGRRKKSKSVLSQKWPLYPYILFYHLRVIMVLLCLNLINCFFLISYIPNNFIILFLFYFFTYFIQNKQHNILFYFYLIFFQIISFLFSYILFLFSISNTILKSWIIGFNKVDLVILWRGSMLVVGMLLY